MAVSLLSLPHTALAFFVSGGDLNSDAQVLSPHAVSLTQCKTIPTSLQEKEKSKQANKKQNKI